MHCPIMDGGIHVKKSLPLSEVNPRFLGTEYLEIRVGSVLSDYVTVRARP